METPIGQRPGPGFEYQSPLSAHANRELIVLGPIALGAVGAAAGDILSVANPVGATVMAKLIIDRTTASTGASTCDFGIAANGTTLNDTLLDGLDTGATAAVASSDDTVNNGTNGLPWRKWTSTQFVTGSEASGDTTGMVGNAYIHYFVV